MFEKILFARTPCLGTCPVFQVEINRKGVVKWHGHQHVFRTGEEEFTISKNKIKKLERLLEEFDYRSFTYPEPGVFATDHPSCITSVMFADGFEKEVYHYLGDMESIIENRKDSLDNLEKFEKKMEQIIGIRKYIQHPPLYLYHLKSDNCEYVVSAPNEKEAIGLASELYKGIQWNVKKIGKDMTGEVIPYVLMDKNIYA